MKLYHGTSDKFTVNQLKNFCQKNNVRYEINPKYSEREHYNIITHKWEKIQTGWYFGMNNIIGTKQGDWQWVLYETFACEDFSEDSYFFFVERYSMAVGKSYKGMNEGWRADQTIRRRMA